MEFLQELLENTQLSILSAFLLGLMTAISPCPLATNITAIGYLSKDIDSQKRVFYNGLIYTLGRAITYTSIGIIFAWFLAFSVGSVGNLYHKIKAFEFWFRRTVAALFIGVGIYYCIIFYF